MSTTISDEKSKMPDFINWSSESDVGMRRDENQDFFGVVEAHDYCVYMVADGMGGSRGGSVASKTAVETVKSVIEQKSKVSKEILNKALKKANEKVFEEAQDNPDLQGMGTTFIGLAFFRNSLFIANVGDSRAYRIRNGNAKSITQDHTLVTELLRTGAITPDQADNHPVSHMLTRSLGPGPELDVDCWKYEYGPARGDYYLICSDGLYNLVKEEEIADVVTSNSIEDAVTELVSMANNRGGPDNITVLLLQVSEDFQKGPEDFVEEDAESDELPTQELENPIVLEAVNKLYSNGTNGDEPGVDSKSSDEKSAEGTSIEGGVSLDNLVFEESVKKAFKDAEEKEATESEAETGKSSKLKKLRGVLIQIILGCLVLVLGAAFLLNYQENQVAELTATTGAGEPQGSDLIEEKVSVVEPKVETASTMKPVEKTEKPIPVKKTNHTNLFSDSTGSRESEQKGLKRRKDEIERRLSLLTISLDSLGEITPIEIRSFLEDAGVRKRFLEDEHSTVQGQLETVTRDLAKWYGRRKRLDSGDPINVAGEISREFPEKRIRKQEFERVTWAYLREVDAWKRDKENQKLRQQMENLAGERTRLLEEIKEEAALIVDDQIKLMHQRTADLTLSRESLESDLDLIKREIGFAEAALDADPKSRDSHTEKLKKEISVLTAEKNEIDRLLQAYDAVSSMP